MIRLYSVFMVLGVMVCPILAANGRAELPNTIYPQQTAAQLIYSHYGYRYYDNYSYYRYPRSQDNYPYGVILIGKNGAIIYYSGDRYYQPSKPKQGYKGWHYHYYGHIGWHSGYHRYGPDGQLSPFHYSTP